MTLAGKKTETAKSPRRTNGARSPRRMLTDPFPRLLPTDETVGFATHKTDLKDQRSRKTVGRCRCTVEAPPECNYP